MRCGRSTKRQDEPAELPGSIAYRSGRARAGEAAPPTRDADILSAKSHRLPDRGTVLGSAAMAALPKNFASSQKSVCIGPTRPNRNGIAKSC